MCADTVRAGESLTKFSDAEVRQLSNQVGRNIHVDRMQKLLQDAEPQGSAEMQFINVQKELSMRGMPG